MTSGPNAAPVQCWIAVLETSEQSANRLADVFTEAFVNDEAAVSLTVAGHGNWRVTVYFDSAPDDSRVRKLATSAGSDEAARSLRFERVTARDWVTESLAGLKPVRAGRFVVHGAHDRARIPFNRVGIEIEAALAFGTGHHGTTRGCLLALDAICKAMGKRRIVVHRHPEVAAKRPSKGDGPGRHPSRRPFGAHLGMTKVLDLGTGSGVLAIAAARTLRRRVLATDIDVEAVRATRANARLNGAAPLIEAVQADGVARRAVLERAPFDLVFANILLGPLQRLAAPLVSLTAPGARIVLSGLLSAQANAAIAAYRPLALVRRIDIEGWTTLVFARRSS